MVECYFCKKRIWFWQATMWDKYHFDCYKQHIIRSLEKASPELRVELIKELKELDLWK